MARIINTALTEPGTIPRWDEDQIYNGIDVLATRQVWDAIEPQLDPTTSATYDFSRALQGPAIEMALRGVRVDRARLSEVLDEFYDKIDFLERNLERIVLEGVGLPHFNWRSPADRTNLFYEKLGIPPIRKKGVLTTDRNARTRLQPLLLSANFCFRER